MRKRDVIIWFLLQNLKAFLGVLFTHHIFSTGSPLKTYCLGMLNNTQIPPAPSPTNDKNVNGFPRS